MSTKGPILFGQMFWRFSLKTILPSPHLYFNCMKFKVIQLKWAYEWFAAQGQYAEVTALSHPSVWLSWLTYYLALETCVCVFFFSVRGNNHFYSDIQPSHLWFLCSAERQHGNGSCYLSEKVSKLQGPQGTVLSRTLQNSPILILWNS